MSKIGPQSEQEIKFNKIKGTQDYETKRRLIGNLTNEELVAYHKQMQDRYGAKMPTFTPAANFLRSVNTVTANTLMNVETESKSVKTIEKSRTTKPTFS